MTIISICIWTSHDISRQLDYSILGRRWLEWMKEPLEKPVQDTAGFFYKATSRHCRIRNSSHGDKRSYTIRLGHRGSPQNSLLTNGRGRNTWFLWKPGYQWDRSVARRAPVWHADATWPTLNQHRFNVLCLLGLSWWATWCLLHIFSS